MTTLVGHGGHAADIAAWFDIPTRVRHHNVLMGARPDREGVIVGINDPLARAEAWDELRSEGWSLAAPQVHPSCVVSGDITFSTGCVAGPLSTFTQALLGQNVHVGAGAHLHRCTVGESTTIAPGAVVCGDVTIGARCMIGAGAVIKNLVTIGNDVTIGAGAVVVADVPDSVTVMGVPARVPA